MATSGPEVEDELFEEFRTKFLEGPPPDNEEAGGWLIHLLTSAISDPNPAHSFRQVKSAVIRTGAVRYVDPLAAIPLLLPFRSPDIDALLDLIAQVANAKENIIAYQEILERMINEIQSLSLEDRIAQDDETETKFATLPQQLIRILRMYIKTIPRISVGNASPLELLDGYLAQLNDFIALLPSVHVTRTEARSVLKQVNLLARAVPMWLSNMSIYDDKRVFYITMVKEPIRTVFLNTLAAVAEHIDSSSTLRLFEAKFPHLVVQSEVPQDWKLYSASLFESQRTSRYIWSLPEDLLQDQSIGTVMIIANRLPLSINANYLLSRMLPLLHAAIQANLACDSALYIIFHSLLTLHDTKEFLHDNIVPDLTSLLVPLAAAHMVVPMRLVCFRILALIVSCSSPATRLPLLQELLTSEMFPQLQSASIALLKENVIVSLSNSDLRLSENPFGSPVLLQAFGAIVFKPNPTDLFQSSLTLEAFINHPESRRLIECLSFYYVLLMRDRNNITRIRDRDQIKFVEVGLLRPLRSAFQRWMQVQQPPEALMTIAAFLTQVERVDAAVAAIYQ